MTLLSSVFNPSSIGATLESVRNSIVNGNITEFSNIGRGIGAIGALLYIAYRVWGSMARAEPIDVFPLLRPFCLCFLIINFSIVTGFVDSIVNGIETKTETMASKSQTNLDAATAKLVEARANVVKKAGEKYLGVGDDTGETSGKEESEDKERTSFFKAVKQAVVDIASFFWKIQSGKVSFFQVALQKIGKIVMGFATVSIDTVATFFLVILGLLGPIVFGVSCFDGFGHMITNWLSRYFSIALWVPIAKILTIILNHVELTMIVNETALYTSGNVSALVDGWVYVCFYVMGIIAYCTIPTIAGWVVDAGSGGGALMSKIVGVATVPFTAAAAVGGAALGGGVGAMMTSQVTNKGVEKITSSDEAPQG